MTGLRGPPGTSEGMFVNYGSGYAGREQGAVAGEDRGESSVVFGIVSHPRNGMSDAAKVVARDVAPLCAAGEMCSVQRDNSTNATQNINCFNGNQ